MIGVLLLVGVVVLAILVILVIQLHGRVDRIDAAATKLADQVGGERLPLELSRLTQRVERLERATAPPAASATMASPARPPVEAPPIVAAHAAATRPIATVPGTPMPPILPAPTPTPPSAAPHAPTTEREWEMVVGTSWLNRIGVLALVIGLALLVGYSMTHVGPAGRVAIGYVVSLTLLGTGVVLERNSRYRSYAYGLIAGGWAGVYFTTYAIHAIDAARLVDSDVVGTALLFAVAAGMIAHSLRYRAEAITALTYIVAFATLALTPVTTFSVVGALLLAASALLVAQRFGWLRVSVLTIVSTYATFILREDVLASATGIRLAPAGALFVYWALFEVADVVALRSQTAHRPEAQSLFLLNAAGLVGAGVLEVSLNTPAHLSLFLAAAALCYLASALVRARLIAPADPASAARAAVAGSAQGAIALAVVLLMWATVTRFHGPRQALALLAEAELVFLSGLVLRDRILRAIALGAVGVTTLSAFTLTASHDVAWQLWQTPIDRWAPVLVAVIVIWIVNFELLLRRKDALWFGEHFYLPLASLLFIATIAAEGPTECRGLSFMLAAALLFERGVRNAREYRWHAYLFATLGTVTMLGVFLTDETLSQQVAWAVLGGGAGLALLMAIRAHMARARLANIEATGVPLVAGVQALALVLTLEWRVAPSDLLDAVWALTGLALVVVAWRLRLKRLHWLAYPALFLGALRTLPLDLVTTRETLACIVVIGSLFATSLLAKLRPTTSTRDAGDEAADAIRMVASLVATALLSALLYRRVRPTMITVAWALEGVALLACGIPFRERVMRLSGLALIFVCILKLFVFDLSSLEPVQRIISFIALGLLLLAVSWVYTRYRETIQKFL